MSYKWHNNETPFARYVRVNGDPWPRLMSQNGLDKEGQGIYDLSLADHYFIKCGHPTWLVSNEVLEVASSFDINNEDAECCFEKLPYECFAFLFERNQKLQSIFIRGETPKWNDRSYLLSKRGDPVGTRCLITCENDDDFCSSYGDDIKTLRNISLLEKHKDEGGLAKARPERQVSYVNLAISLLMLWRSRPHFVKEVILPRSERYQFKRDRKNLRQWIFPTELITRIRSSSTNDGGGLRVLPHWRAGHFRHYRNERYERMPDGSVRIEFIEPCFVGDKKSSGVKNS